MWFSFLLAISALTLAHGSKFIDCRDVKQVSNQRRLDLLSAMRTHCHKRYWNWDYNKRIKMDLEYSPTLECLIRHEYANNNNTYIPSWYVFEVSLDSKTREGAYEPGLIYSIVQADGWICHSASTYTNNDIFACAFFNLKGSTLWVGEDRLTGTTRKYGCAFYKNATLWRA